MATESENADFVSSLIAKRAEIAGRIEYAQLDLRRMIGELDTIDASIRVFAPELAMQTPKKRLVPPQHQALRGAVKATILKVLGEAEGPVTTETLAYQLMRDRCLPEGDVELRRLMIGRVGSTLHYMWQAGQVAKDKLPGKFKGWQLTEARPPPWMQLYERERIRHKSDSFNPLEQVEMAKVAAFHTKTPEDGPDHRNVYHDQSECHYGKAIKAADKVAGTDGRPKCSECTRL